MDIQLKEDLNKFRFLDESFGMPLSLGHTLNELSGYAEFLFPLIGPKSPGLLNFFGGREHNKYRITHAGELLGIINDQNLSILEWHNKRFRDFEARTTLAISTILFPMI